MGEKTRKKEDSEGQDRKLFDVSPGTRRVSGKRDAIFVFGAKWISSAATGHVAHVMLLVATTLLVQRVQMLINLPKQSSEA